MTVQADLAPMLAELAGVEWPRKPIARRGAVYLEYYAKQKWVNPIRTIRTSRWKLNWYDSGHQELYDLENDAEERHNVASDEATRRIRIELETRLNAWRGPTKQ